MNKLILLDVFSYSCMNCLRSLNYIKKIDSKYKKYGLETIIIHPPEWEFEKDDKNIKNALKKYKLKFPIITDNDKKIIKKLKIDFWPTQILIRNGKILYKHVGEGNYKRLEDKIIKLLNIRTEKIFNKEPRYSKFPTIYLGKKKGNKLINLNNKWVQKNEFLQSIEKESSLSISTKGQIINFVAESLIKKPIKITIKINNKILKKLSINKPKLYNITKLKNKKQKQLTVITNPGLAIYSFSFQ